MMDDMKNDDALCSELKTNPTTMDGGDALLKLSGEEKEVPMKACNMCEEEKECAFGGVNYEETANEEVTAVVGEGKQVKPSANNNANKSRKRGKKVKAKTKAAGSRRAVAKITIGQEPSDKGMVEETDSIAGDEENKLTKQGVEEENAGEGMTNKEDARVSIFVGALEQREEVNNNEKAGVDVANEKNVEEAVNNGENTGEDVTKATGINEVVKGEQVKPMPENPVNKSRKARLRKKNKITLTDTAAVVPKNGKRPESSEKKTSKSMGMIFMCSSKTKKDCYRYQVLGLPASKRDLVLTTVFEGMKLFLFDVDLKLLYGIYKAAGPGGYNIEPKAFKAAFPSQVRFTVHEDCLPIPEEKFRSVIKDNYYQKNKFSCELTSEQVKNLCKLFQNASRSLKSKWPLRAESRKHGKDKNRKQRSARAEDSFPVQDRSRKRGRDVGRAETHTFVDRERSRKRYRELEKYPIYGRDRVYSDGLDAYKRHVHVSPVPPLPLYPPLPAPTSAPALPPPYIYGRAAEINISRRSPLIEQHDRQFLDSELRRQQHVDYGREALNSYHDRWYRDMEYRRADEPYLHHSHLYYDQVNSAAQSSSYYPSSGISRDTAAQSSSYYPSSGISRDTAAQSSSYYPSSGISRDTAALPPEYQPLRSIYRY